MAEVVLSVVVCAQMWMVGVPMGVVRMVPVTRQSSGCSTHMCLHLSSGHMRHRSSVHVVWIEVGVRHCRENKRKIHYSLVGITVISSSYNWRKEGHGNGCKWNIPG